MNEAPLIGGSILEFIDQRTITNDAPQSVIHSLITPTDCRLLVKGPHATSLAMNTVYSIACHCQCQQVTCQCVAVAFLTLDKTPWPLFCQQTPRNLDDTDDIELKLRTFEGIQSTWDPRALKRIQVIRFRSSRDLVSYLLNFQSNPKRPWGAVVVDSVDSFVCRGGNNVSVPPDEAMQMTRILALLAETGNTLARMGADSLLVMATMRLSLPPNVERVVRNWYPGIINVEQQAGKMEDSVPKGDTIQSSWVAKLVDDDGKNQIGFSVVQRNSDGEVVILWTQRASRLN